VGQQHVKICESLSNTKNGFQCEKAAKPQRGPDAMAKRWKEVMLGQVLQIYTTESQFSLASESMLMSTKSF
jgi:hypothetical protein